MRRFAWKITGRLALVLPSRFQSLSSRMSQNSPLNRPRSIEKVMVVAANAIKQRRLQIENTLLREVSQSKHRILGESVPMKALRQQMSLMAGTNGRVLIFGESGTGKELIAHAIHTLSA